MTREDLWELLGILETVEKPKHSLRSYETTFLRRTANVTKTA